MQVEFHGAAREVTGSCHILRVNGHTVLLDCGLFQGRRKESDEKNRRLPVPIEEVDAIVLSHAHIDHAGRLPFLARHGYSNSIWCTSATRDLCSIMLADSAHIQEKDAEHLSRREKEAIPPLYTMRDAARVAELMVSVPYNREFDVVPGLKARFVDAGHILGSASVILEATEGGTTKRLVFAGDVGRWGLPIIRDPQPPDGADFVILESTYGNRDHDSVEGARERLGAIVRETAARGGRIMIPAFAVGRTQEIVYDLHALRLAGKVPALPIFIDSPLAIDATTVFAEHPEVFDQTEDLVATVDNLFEFERVQYTRKVEESKHLNTINTPIIIVAASGMAETGRIVHHLIHGASDPRNTILVVGFMAEHTTGRRIVERQPELKLFGDEVPLRAQVEVLNGYSAHADRTELLRWLDAVKAHTPSLRDVYLVHGEPDAQDAFAARLGELGYTASCPHPGMKVDL